MRVNSLKVTKKDERIRMAVRGIVWYERLAPCLKSKGDVEPSQTSLTDQCLHKDRPKEDLLQQSACLAIFECTDEGNAFRHLRAKH